MGYKLNCYIYTRKVKLKPPSILNSVATVDATSDTFAATTVVVIIMVLVVHMLVELELEELDCHSVIIF
ncbi:21359_t:CDS:2 [Rhizophagus irregularis]|nr:21359_t:CDS:2 [Rhizophagus irregularis]